MCVIVYKPSGVKLTDDTIKKCFDENPNGAGFTIIWERDNFVTRKGFMTYDELKAELNLFGGDLTPFGLVLHFRIMTSGIVNPINTHPYPITHKPDLLTQTELINIPVVYHNGVLFGQKTSYTDDINLYSDSFLLARDILSRTDNTGIQNTLNMIANTTNNKFCYIDKHGTVLLFGDFTKHDDVYYSNMYWKEPRTVVYSWGEWNGTFWDYEKNKTKPKTEPAKTEPAKTAITTGYSKVCKKCKTFLYSWERDNGVCVECDDEPKIYKPKTPAIITPDGVRVCASCGVILNPTESMYCDDCLEWYTNPNHNNGG